MNVASSIAEKDVYYDFIDGLRGIAVLLVVAVHTSQGMGYYYSPDFGSFTRELWGIGARGVDLFFILSAFTLFNSSHKRFLEDERPVLSFYLRRAFRILPLWWTSVVIYGYLNDKSVSAMLASAFFYFGFVRFDQYYEVVGGGWSLFVEETFYLFLPLIFAKIVNFKSSLKALFLFLVIMKVWARGAAVIGVPTSNSFVLMFPLANWPSFAYGITIYYLLKEPRFKAMMACRKKRVALDALAIIAVVTLLLKPLTLSTFALALFFTAASFEDTICGRIARSKTLITFGSCCFSIYLFHGLIFRIIHSSLSQIMSVPGLESSSLQVKSGVAFILMTAACLPFGLLSFNLFEKPAVRFGKQIIRRLNPQKQPEQMQAAVL